MKQPDISDEKVRYDLAEIRKAIRILFPAGQVVEVRMMNKKKRLNCSGWYDDHEIMAKHVAKLARDGFGDANTYRFIQENVYWTVNPVHEGLLARQTKNMIQWAEETTSDNNILRRIWLPIDIDPLRPSGIGSTAEEKQLARKVTLDLGQKLLDFGFLETNMFVGLSGNGYHLPIRVDLPNDTESRDLVKRCLAAMQEMVGTAKVEVDPKIFNAARIMKCYGTMSCKGVDTPGRPWRLAKILKMPDTIEPVSRDLLEKLAALAPDKNPKRALGEKRQGPWTEENTQEYLDWTGWECGNMGPAGQPHETAKWIGPCIVDLNHKDSAVILHSDGWWSYGCFHASCGVNDKDFKKHWEEVQGGSYEYPGVKANFVASDNFEFEDACDPAVPATPKKKPKVKLVFKPGEKPSVQVVGEESAEVEEAEEIDETSVPTIVAPAKVQMQAWNLTDAGNAERFVARYGRSFRYCPQRGWYSWDGKRWAADSIGRVLRGATESARKIVPQELPLHLAGIVDADRAKEIEGAVRAWAKKSESNNSLKATEYLARYAKSIEVKHAAFDCNPWAFNCANGTIDLTTGACQPHMQADLITKVSPVEYDPKATCPLWLDFLGDITSKSQELMGYLQRAVGYSLTGSTAEHCLFLLHGSGRNGKSTFIELVRYLLGDYGVAAHMNTFLVKKGDSIPNDLAALASARMVAAVETEESKRLDEPKIKQITGGDTITARFLHKEFFDFKPQFKIWLATNALPVIRGTDEGIWRRMKRIPFDVYIPDGKKDEKLGEKLRSEASGILNWALEGLEDYRRNGLEEPQCVTEATEAYRGSQDWLERFVAEETEKAAGPNDFIQARKLYERFVQWAERTGEYCVKEVKFAEAMESHGHKKARPYVGGKQVAFQAYVGRKLRDHLVSFGAGFEDAGVGAMDEL